MNWQGVFEMKTIKKYKIVKGEYIGGTLNLCYDCAFPLIMTKEIVEIGEAEDLIFQKS